MDREAFQRIRDGIPEEPGVYLFLDVHERPLYIGKAAVLRERVATYFRGDLLRTRSPAVARAVRQASSLSWRVCGSVVEALLLEAALIRQWKPPGNTRSKDDKSYWVVVVTNERWPRVLPVRAHRLHEHVPAALVKEVFGPFPHGAELRAALRTLKRLFPHFDTRRPVDDPRSRKAFAHHLRFYRALGLYPEGDDEAARRRYLRTIRHLSLFLGGKKTSAITAIKRDMYAAASRHEFEYAARLRDQLAALLHLRDVALIKQAVESTSVRIEAYDIAHHGGKHAVAVMVVHDGVEFVRDAYRTFLLRSVAPGDDPAGVREVVGRRLQHPEWPYPTLIVVDGGAAQVRAAQLAVASAGLSVPIVGVAKDRRHRPERIVGTVPHGIDPSVVLAANAEAHRAAIYRHRMRARREALG